MMEQKKIIVLIFDTLRSDYLSCYGGETDTTAFQRAAGDGVLFESAFGVAPGTPISHASVYSGQYPSEHGVTGQYLPLPEDVPVMAEWFRSTGYDTFGITGPSKMGSDWGYDRGFNELFEPYYDMPSPTSLENVYKALIDDNYRNYFLRQITKGGQERTRFKFNLLQKKISSDLDRPFFTLCNFTTAHGPYDPPRPYKTNATPGFTRPRLFLTEFLFDNHGKVEDPDIRFERIVNLQYGDGAGRYLANPDYLNEKEIKLLRDWYTASIEYLDDELDRFLEFYRRELIDDTILVLTADHGEQLGEHGLWEHSYYFYDETLKIPLIILGPDLPEGKRRADIASHVDMFDTLCDLCDIEPPTATSGNSLFGGENRTAAFMEYGERDLEDFGRESNIHGKHLSGEKLREFAAGRKAIRTEKYRFEVASNGTERLFTLPDQSLVSDPPEDVTSELRERLHETLGDDFGVWPEEEVSATSVDQQVEENLRNLGYIE